MGSVLPLIFGIVIAAIPSFIGGAWVRRKNKAEENGTLATAADTLAHGAVSLVPYYEKRINDLEHRVEAAEKKAFSAAADAYLARQQEEMCRTRLTALEARLDEMMRLLAHSTTTTTTVTNHPPEGG